MSGKNIYIVNQFAGTPQSGWGERHFYFGKFWLNMGHTVNIISATYNHMFKEEKLTSEKFLLETHEGRHFCWIKTPRYNPQSVGRFWSMMIFAWRVLFLPVDKLGKPDVIVVSSMPIFPILTANWLRRRYKKCKLIFEIRDLWPETPIHLAGYSRRHPFIMMLAAIEKYGFRNADYIVSLLPNAAPYINNISKSPEKFHYVPNGLSSELLENESISDDLKNEIPRNKFIVGYAGTIGLANALEYFTEAARLLKAERHIHFVITGDGYLKKSLQQQCADLENITFLPHIPKNQVQSLLKNFDVCFVGRNGSPLFQHGVSANKYFDYMLAAKPILDSNNRIKDPVELSGCGIIVQPDNARAIRNGVVQFFEMNAKERSMMGQKGNEYLIHHHNIRHLAADYAQLF